MAVSDLMPLLQRSLISWLVHMWVGAWKFIHCHPYLALTLSVLSQFDHLGRLLRLIQNVRLDLLCHENPSYNRGSEAAESRRNSGVGRGSEVTRVHGISPLEPTSKATGMQTLERGQQLRVQI